MQVNPIGINSYQQLNRSENPAERTDNVGPAQAEANKVTITPQEKTGSSRLAVKAVQGSYADNLTEAETRALDLLFSRFQDTGRFGPGYGDDTNGDSSGSALGNVVDLKA